MRQTAIVTTLALGTALVVSAARIQNGAAAAEVAGGPRGATTQLTVAQHPATFDDLDFNVFTHQKWDQLSKSHSNDIIVHWPDGHETRGIQRHIEDLKAMFVYAPDTRIQVHPVKFGSGEWTSVIGLMEGTFTAPMPVPNATPVAPTGKAFKLSMNTIGRWNAQGTMDEEWLFWDNATYMRQLGLAKEANPQAVSTRGK